MALLEVAEVSKIEEGELVVNNVSFTQEQGQKLAIAGATGSGKTSLMKMIAGLVEPSSGTLLFKEKRIAGPNERLIPGHPSIAYLSQYFELRNHYRVKDFLSMAAKVPDAEAEAIYLLCRIDHLLVRWTHQLSGGEKQRIALARLLITQPQLLLLDEPFSNLDPIHKNILKSVIEDLSNQSGLSCILVSHDPIDTLSWADEILVLKNGGLLQKGRPEEIYFNPADEYAATLFGKYNLVNSELAEALTKFANKTIKENTIIRPNQIKLVSADQGLPGKVLQVRFMGSFYETEIVVGKQKLILHIVEGKLREGEEVYLTIER